jgi:DNA polymerase-4
MHLDMDAFYASVEQRDSPALRNRPVIVGGSPQSRGVVCAASYEARKFGVRSAMPCSIAARLCPIGLFVPPRMTVYREESKAIMQIMRDFEPIIEQVSVDEAYLDFTGKFQASEHDQCLDLATPVARNLQRAIQQQRQLSASIGVASNKMLSKLGSDFNKPNGLTVIHEKTKLEFLRPLSIGVIHGVGKVTQTTLENAGIYKVKDLQQYGGNLEKLVGVFGNTLRQYALGEDSRSVCEDYDIKSVSSENTFAQDTDDRPTLRSCLRSQSNDIERRLKRNLMTAHTLQVKVRYSDFTTLTRQLTLEDPIQEAKQIYRLSCHILAREKLVERPLRLIGVGVSNLREQSWVQLKLPLEEITKS